jgi:2',3'-cyclic-nucleotide 2'-phosphodiesterase (5'-nucleotidase family)
MLLLPKTAVTIGVVTFLSLTCHPAFAVETITLIHMGDIHGHLVPRPASPRGDAQAIMEGGLARMFTAISKIRQAKGANKTLLLNTGDTIQGSAEALFTRGQAIVNVLNGFAITAYAPGNWDWVYGIDRALELFAGDQAQAPWGAVAANAYFEGEPYANKTGQRLLPPYIVREVNGVRVGLLGFTTDRGPQVVGRDVTKGVKFTKGDSEYREFVRVLREEQKVDLLVILSELGHANNIRLAEAIPGADVILSSDMHEVTAEPVRTRNGTLVVEAGQDGQVLGQLDLTIDGGRVTKSEWTLHRIDDRIKQDPGIEWKVTDVRKTFVKGPNFTSHINPFNGTRLTRPIDTVVGQTAVPLHRTGFSHQSMPAVIEGTSHNLLTDAFRSEAEADVGAIRGFRYGTVVRPGPIHMEDLYHFIPIGPLIAKGTVKGKQIKGQIENSVDGSLNRDVSKWTGGWLFNFSGLTMDLDVAAEPGSRARRINVFSHSAKSWQSLDPEADYTYASYYYERDPTLINGVEARNISILKDDHGVPIDGVDVVIRYLSKLPERRVRPFPNRITLVRPLPAPVFGQFEVQPWRGVDQEGKRPPGSTEAPETAKRSLESPMRAPEPPR